MFGGSSGQYLNDLWRLDLSGSPAWTQVSAPGAPAQRVEHSAVYDPDGHRMVVFGGRGLVNGFDGVHQDLRALSLGSSPSWSLLATAGPSPGPRYGHAAIHDPDRSRMILFGGYDGSVYHDDLWAVTLTGTPAWTPLAARGTPPPALAWSHPIYDPASRSMVLFGGYDGNVRRDDLWVLSLDEPLEWLPVPTSGPRPPGRMLGIGVYDPTPGRLLVHGGTNGTSRLDDLWSIDLPLCPVPVFASQPASRNVSSGATAVFTVDAGEDMPGRTYHWRRNGVPLVEDGRRSGTGTATLTIAPAHTGDAGAYDVVAREACGTSVSSAATLTVSGPTAVGSDPAPLLALAPPSPNPSTGRLTLSWTQPRPGHVSLALHDPNGRRVRTLVDEVRDGGRHDLTWRTAGDAPVPTGLYWVRLRFDGREMVRRVTILN